MTSTRLVRALPAAVLAVVLLALAGCAGGGAGSTTPAPPVAATTPSEPSPPPPGGTPADPARADVERVFHDASRALLARDFPAVCAVSAPEATDALLPLLRARGVPADTCEEALTAIYAQPGAAQAADRLVTGARVQDVTVTGDDATVTWTVPGGPSSMTAGFHRVDGRWQVVEPGV